MLRNTGDSFRLLYLLNLAPNQKEKTLPVDFRRNLGFLLLFPAFQIVLLLTQVSSRLRVCMCHHLPSTPVRPISTQSVRSMGKYAMNVNLKAPSIRKQSRTVGTKEKRNIFFSRPSTKTVLDV